MHDVAGVHQPQADAAGDGRGDVTVDQVQLGAVDLPLIGSDNALILRDQSLLRGELLLGDGVLFDQLLVTAEIHLRVLEQRLVADQGALGLLELHLVGARIDFEQRRALLHDIAFLVVDLHQLPVHARFHRDGIDGGDVAQTGDVLADIAADGLHRHHRDGAEAAAALAAAALACRSEGEPRDAPMTRGHR